MKGFLWKFDYLCFYRVDEIENMKRNSVEIPKFGEDGRLGVNQKSRMRKSRLNSMDL